ncbi:Rieske 2Fe-2S domain-containing protein [Pseudopelagicola sp. nBUS_20]|uniref:Rieske 2Fe-2S domain-containing protein n=1 Tax=Pseudopelagicola sp. nBUS_20 TaxID=3395317 RepID=UPI003EBD1F48
MITGYWQVVARSSEIGLKPKRVWLLGNPVVLFRTKNGIHALHDRCPHRHAELSKGRVLKNTIECPYHGWRFDEDGVCVEIPGCLTDLPKIRVPNYSVCEKDGGIFLSKHPMQNAPYVHVLTGQSHVVRMVKSKTQSTLIDVAENILDATHTHFTHKGLLRGLSQKRHLVQVELVTGEDWLEITYTGEDRQDGIISRFLDGDRVKTVGRYRRPGIAELEYWGTKGLVLATTFHLRQVSLDTVEGIGWLTGPRSGGLGYLKALIFAPFFKIALEQDRRVLQSAFNNAQSAEPLIGPLDFLRRDIEAIEAGQSPTYGPRHFEMLL